MTPNAQHHPHIRPYRTATAILAGALLLLLALLPLAPEAATAQPVTSGVLSIRAVVPPLAATIVSIQGEGFTPGGIVQIVIAGLGDTDLRHHAWVVASPGSWGLDGSGDPANGFVAAGTFAITILLDAEAVYGPNGSQDPAQGYTPGNDVGAWRAAACGQGLDVRAYDHDSRSWSDQVELVRTCQA